MKAYKGFNKDMTCRGFRFEEGKEYEEEKADLCEAGFHACEAPIDCFRYYEPSNSVYRVVELSDVSDQKDDDTKRVGKKIRIGAALDVVGLCKAQFEYVKEHTNFENTDPKQATAGEFGAATAGDRGAATAGYRGAATAGEFGAATAGEFGAATAGDRGAATAGEFGAATAGDRGAATAGEFGAATAGDRGAATAGYRGAATAGEFGAATAGEFGAATAGYRGAATSRGSVSVGENGCGLVRGRDVKAKGGIGAVLVMCIENDDGDIKEVKTIIVDGKKVKPDTWYTVKARKIVEVKE